MKVPKEILKYLEYALGFCEERGIWDDYKKIAEIIVENDKNKEFKWVHEELLEIREHNKQNKTKRELERLEKKLV